MTPPTVDVYNTKATFVDSSELSEDPFHSVPKYLVLYARREKIPCLSICSQVNLDGAKDIIFTAAHNLWDEDGLSHHISFVPGMKCRCDPPPYGVFNANAVAYSSGWNPHLESWEAVLQYDFGIVRLEKVNEKAVGDIVPPLDILWDEPNGPGVKWKTLAYPRRMPAVGDDTVDDNPTQKMMQQDGQYVLTHKGAVKRGVASAN